MDGKYRNLSPEFENGKYAERANKQNIKGKAKYLPFFRKRRYKIDITKMTIRMLKERKTTIFSEGFV
jgi:hypothetical protein